MAPYCTPTGKWRSSAWNCIFREALKSTEVIHFWEREHATSIWNIGKPFTDLSKVCEMMSFLRQKTFWPEIVKAWLKNNSSVSGGYASTVSHILEAITTGVWRQEGLKVAMMCACLLVCVLVCACRHVEVLCNLSVDVDVALRWIG